MLIVLLKKQIIRPKLLRLILSYQALIVTLLKIKMSLIKLQIILYYVFFSEDGSQAYLIFQPIYRYFKTITNTNYILSWRSRGLSAESIKPHTTSDNSLNPELIILTIRVKFTGSCLKQSKITNTYKKLVNIYIVYGLGASSSHIDDPTLKNCLFVAVTLTKNADTDKYGYSGYGIGFDRRGSFSFPSGGYSQNVLSRYEFFSSY